MHLVGSVYTRHTNERIGRDGPLFRGRFHAVPVVDDDQLLCTVRYVHRNALDLPGIDSVESYRWSSHRSYLGHRAPPPFLSTAPVLKQFDSRRAFDAFVTSETTARPSTWKRDLALDRIAPLVQIIADEIGEVHGSRALRSLLLLAADELPQHSAQALRERLGFATPEVLAAGADTGQTSARNAASPWPNRQADPRSRRVGRRGAWHQVVPSRFQCSWRRGKSAGRWSQFHSGYSAALSMQ